MAEYDDEFDFDIDENSGGDLVKKLRKQLSEMSKALKERDEMLSEFVSQTRAEQIGESLVEMGLSPKIAAFVPDDVEDEDDLREWLDAYGDAFGYNATDAVQNELDLAPETVQAAELMSAVEEGGIDPTVGQSLEMKIQNASSPDELAALLRG